MPTSIHLGPLVLPVGPQSLQIDAPTRANGATIRLTRTVVWPVGPVFDWVISERDRGGTLLELARGSESGGAFIGKNGDLNPPLLIALNWAADKDKDTLQFDINVHQIFTTEVFIDWVL